MPEHNVSHLIDGKFQLEVWSRLQCLRHVRQESDCKQNSGTRFMYSGAELNFELQPWADVTAFKEAIAAAPSKAVAPHPQLLNLWCLKLISASSYEKAVLALSFIVQVRKLKLCGSDVLLSHRLLVQVRNKLLYPNSKIWEKPGQRPSCISKLLFSPSRSGFHLSLLSSHLKVGFSVMRGNINCLV